MIREIWEEGRDIRAQYQCDQCGHLQPGPVSSSSRPRPGSARVSLFIHGCHGDRLAPPRRPSSSPTPRVVTPPDSPGTYTAAAVLPLSASARGNAICNNTFSLFHGSGCKGRNIAAPAKAITVSAPQMFIYFQMSYFVCFVTFKRKYNS